MGKMQRRTLLRENGRPQPTALALRGFSLIELMITVAVVAILAVVALPSYSAYVIRSKRAEAKTALLQAAQYLERNFSQAGCYDFTDAPSCNNRGPIGNGQAVGVPATSVTDYVIALGAAVPPPTAAAPGQGYSLSATPCGEGGGCANGSNFDDPDCGVLTLDQTGAKGAVNVSNSVNTATATGTVLAGIQKCWQR
jgi:type IV pilus assembly protein PilE